MRNLLVRRPCDLALDEFQSIFVVMFGLCVVCVYTYKAIYTYIDIYVCICENTFWRFIEVENRHPHTHTHTQPQQSIKIYTHMQL